MKIIKQLEAKKFNDRNDLLGCARDAGIDIAIEILRSQTVIEAKVLRKKGTNIYYYFSGDDEWCEDLIPVPFTGNIEDEINNDEYFPEDAELVDIEIHINPDQR